MARTKQEDRRLDIMRAAEGLFQGGRIHEITLDEVARRAKVGKGTIYRYFADKEDLFFQTATSGFEDLCGLLEREVPDDAPFGDRLLRACEQIAGFFDSRRELFRMMEVEQSRLGAAHKMHKAWCKKRRHLVDALAAILAAGQEHGALRPDVPAAVLAAFLFGMLRTRYRDLEEASQAERSVTLVLNLFLDGARLAARRPKARGKAS